jgi:hypothetical protein
LRKYDAKITVPSPTPTAIAMTVLGAAIAYAFTDIVGKRVGRGLGGSVAGKIVADLGEIEALYIVTRLQHRE